MWLHNPQRRNPQIQSVYLLVIKVLLWFVLWLYTSYLIMPHPFFANLFNDAASPSEKWCGPNSNTTFTHNKRHLYMQHCTTCMYTYTHIYTHTHMHTNVHINKHIHIHTYMYVHKHTHTHMYAHKHTHTHIHVRTQTHAHTHTCTHTNTHTHTNISNLTLTSVAPGVKGRRHGRHDQVPRHKKHHSQRQQPHHPVFSPDIQQSTCMLNICM